MKLAAPFIGFNGEQVQLDGVQQHFNAAGRVRVKAVLFTDRLNV